MDGGERRGIDIPQIPSGFVVSPPRLKNRDSKLGLITGKAFDLLRRISPSSHLRVTVAKELDSRLLLKDSSVFASATGQKWCEFSVHTHRTNHWSNARVALHFSSAVVRPTKPLSPRSTLSSSSSSFRFACMTLQPTMKLSHRLPPFPRASRRVLSAVAVVGHSPLPYLSESNKGKKISFVRFT